MLSAEEIRNIKSNIAFHKDQLAKFEKYGASSQAAEARKEIKLLEKQLPRDTSFTSFARSTVNDEPLYIDLTSPSQPVEPNLSNISLNIENEIPLELSDLDFYRWVFKDDDMAAEEFPDGVATDGYGPFGLPEFDELIEQLDIRLSDVGGNNDVVILGREGWDSDNLDEHIENRKGQTLRVYSQEMFLAQLISGRDPYEDKEILKRFAKGHPALEYLINSGFHWPETTIVPGDGLGEIDDPDDWPNIGLLKRMGYHVGANAEGEDYRHEILNRVFTSSQLPNVKNSAHMAEWGDAHSAKRLLKMANAISTFAKNAKRNPNSSSLAIKHWETDLEWLKNEFYRGSFTFDWPSTYVH